jgi:hypothetical protein
MKRDRLNPSKLLLDFVAVKFQTIFIYVAGAFQVVTLFVSVYWLCLQGRETME